MSILIKYETNLRFRQFETLCPYKNKDQNGYNVFVANVYCTTICKHYIRHNNIIKHNHIIKYIECSHPPLCPY